MATCGAVGVAALVLAGCSNDPEEVSAEPGVVLSSPEVTAAPPPAPTDDLPPENDSTPDDQASVDDDLALPDAPTVVDEAAELEVEDQRGDGRSVRVHEVRFSSGTAMVGIYDAGLKLLGFSAVQSSGQPVTVQLDRQVASSQELIAVLHRDDGDGSLGAEDPVAVEEGEQVSEDFDYLLD